ncbi:MAG: hypothetical protein LBM07_03345 [Culturomica sp.]|jgi:hypothetical protein|nr:hypothetical protein [Culturomica sp.]
MFAIAPLSGWAATIVGDPLTAVAGRDSIEYNLHNARLDTNGSVITYKVNVRLKRLTPWLQMKEDGTSQSPSINLAALDMSFELVENDWYTNLTSDSVDIINNNNRFPFVTLRPKVTSWYVISDAYDVRKLTSFIGKGYVNNFGDTEPLYGSYNIALGDNYPVTPANNITFSDTISYITLATLEWELKPGYDPAVYLDSLGIAFTPAINVVHQNGNMDQRVEMAFMYDANVPDYLNQRRLNIGYSGNGSVKLTRTMVKPEISADTILCGLPEKDFIYTIDNHAAVFAAADTCIWSLSDLSGSPLPVEVGEIKEIYGKGDSIRVAWKDYSLAPYNAFKVEVYAKRLSTVSELESDTVVIRMKPYVEVPPYTYVCVGSTGEILADSVYPSSGVTGLWTYLPEPSWGPWNNIYTAFTEVGEGEYKLVYSLNGCVDSVVTEVVKNVVPTVDVDPLFTYCDADLDSVILHVNSAVGRVVWLADDGITEIDSVIYNTAPEINLYVRAEALSGGGGTCTSGNVPVTVKFGVAPELEIQTLPPFTSCNGQVNVELTSITDPTATIHWLAPNRTTTLATGSPAVLNASSYGDGVYYVYASNPSATPACVSDTLAFNIMLNTKPQITINDTITSCAVDSVDVALQSISDAGATVKWFDQDRATVLGTGTATKLPVLNGTGIYYVAALGNGCSSDTIPFIIETGKVPSISMPADITYCGGNTVTFALTSLSSPSATVVWLDYDNNIVGTGNPFVSNLSGGEYKVFAFSTDENGLLCSSDTLDFSLTLGKPMLTLTDSIFTSCTDDVTVKVSSISDASALITWEEVSSGRVVGTGSPFIITSVAGGADRLYKVYAELPGGSCVSDPITFKVRSNSGPVIGIGQDPVFTCDTVTRFLLGSISDPTAVVKWYDEAYNLVGTGNPVTFLSDSLVPSDYYVAAYGEGGCASDTLPFTVFECGHFEVIASVEDTICSNNLAYLTAKTRGIPADELTYEWSVETPSTPLVFTPYSVGAQDTSYLVPAAGDYRFAVTVTSKDGTKTVYDTVATYVRPEVAPDITSQPFACLGDSIVVSSPGAVSYEWYVNDVLQTSMAADDSVFNLVNAGAYTVKVRSFNGTCYSNFIEFNLNMTDPAVRFALSAPSNVVINTPFNVEAEGYNGLAPYTYEWLLPAARMASPDSVYSIPFANEMDYWFAVRVEDANGCPSDTAYWHVEVNGYTPLTVDLVSVFDDTVCRDGGAMLVASVLEGDPLANTYTFSWFKNGSLTPEFVKTVNSKTDTLYIYTKKAEDYTVRVRYDVSPAWLGMDSLHIEYDGSRQAPYANAGPDITIAMGAQTVLAGDAGGQNIVKWMWKPTNMLEAGEDTLQYPMTAPLFAQQKYKLTVADDKGCMSTPDSVVVKINDNTGLDIVVTPEIDTLCINNHLTLTVAERTGLSGITYSWMPSALLTAASADNSSMVFAATTAGSYTFLVQARATTGEVAFGRVDIHVETAEAPQITFDLTNSGAGGACSIDTVRVNLANTVSEADTFIWVINGQHVENDTSFYAFVGRGKMIYEAGVITKNGCMSDMIKDSITVAIAPSITVTMTDSCDGVTLFAVAKGQFDTIYADSIVPTGFDVRQSSLAHDMSEFELRDSGTYTVRIIAIDTTNGCFASEVVSGVIYPKPIINWLPTTGPTDAVLVSKADTFMRVQAVADSGLPYSVHAYNFTWEVDGTEVFKEKNDTSTYAKIPLDSIGTYNIKVWALDSNNCRTNELVKQVSVLGDSLKVNLKSVYGDIICVDGTAMLVANVQGGEQMFDFTWKKYNDGGNITVKTVADKASNMDTLFVNDADTWNYYVEISDGRVSPEPRSGADTLSMTTFTRSSNKAAQIVAAPDEITIPAGTNTALIADVTDMGDATSLKWHWTPTNLIAAGDTSAQYPMTNIASLTAPNSVKYKVYAVDDNGCVTAPDSTMVVIDNVNGFRVIVDPASSLLCMNNSVILTAKVISSIVGDTYTYAWHDTVYIDPDTAQQTRFTAPAVADASYRYAVAVTNSEGYTSTAVTDIKVNNLAAPLFTLSDAYCVGDTIYLTNEGAEVNASGYTWDIDGLPYTSNKDYVVLAKRGETDIKLVASADNGCVSDTARAVVKVGTRPVIDIRLHETWGGFAKEADSTYKMAIDQSKINASAVNSKWGYLPTSAINDTVDQNRFDLTMRMRGDATIYYTAADTLNDKCFGSDTVNAYIIPGRMPLDIDKYAEEENKLYLHWDTTGVPAIAYIDSVRVMSIKWDGYAIVNQYARRAMVAKGDTLYDVRTDNDTLEFFYVQGSRYIEEAKQRFYSRTSDTVGYYKQWLYGQASGGGEYNYISYPFDMSNKGLPTVDSLLKLLSNKRGMSISKYLMSTQNWSSRSFVLGPVGTVGDFDLIPGTIYRIVTKDVNKELLFYGKLPRPFTYNLERDPSRTRNYNFIADPMALITANTLGSLGDNITTARGIEIYSWDFNNQTWRNRAVRPIATGPGNWTTSNKQNIYTWLPVRVVIPNAIDGWTK